tara:strand:- start:50 stop:202 length:153 start_codon:yes stop_codon:yes gene_type:complete
MSKKTMPLDTDAKNFNKYSLADLEKVLDQIEIDPIWESKLRQIVEDQNNG